MGPMSVHVDDETFIHTHLCIRMVVCSTNLDVVFLEEMYTLNMPDIEHLITYTTRLGRVEKKQLIVQGTGKHGYCSSTQKRFAFFHCVTSCHQGLFFLDRDIVS